MFFKATWTFSIILKILDDENAGQVTLNPIKSFQIAAGKYFRDFNKKDTLQSQLFDVAKIERHSDYRGKSKLNIADIAYVVINGFIKYQPHIGPICMKLGHDIE